MMESPFGRTLYPAALLLWLGAFGWKACAVSNRASELARESEKLEDQAEAIDGGARRLARLVREADAQARDARFLESLPNILPENKSYLRTQKAIADEAAELRAKVSRRLKGALHLVVDAKANKLYVKKGSRLLWQAD